MPRCLPLALLLASLICPAAFGQEKEKDEVEKIEPPKTPDTSDKRPDYNEAVKQIVDSTNAFRKEEGHLPVAVNKELTLTAEAFAKWMAKEDTYGHTADGQKPADRAKKQGYDYCIVLENIAYAFRSSGFETKPLAEGYFEGWKKSPGHRKNMLDTDVTETGVAIARSETTGYYYAVQMFGRPKSAAIVFKIENRAAEAVSYTIGEEKFDLEPRKIVTHTRCRPEEVKFPALNATIKPANGEAFVVSKDGGKVAVRKQ